MDNRRRPGPHGMILVLALAIFTVSSQAQTANPYGYQCLSHLVNAHLRDSLKKNWLAPALYKDKETQKKFKEFWDSRTEFLTAAIDNKDFIQEKEVFDYVDGILGQLQAGNSRLIPQKPLLLIDRSGAVNAYSVGGKIIAVNLGLIAFASSREELALVIAHELSHDILGHVENAIKERAEWLTSDEYKRSVKEVLDTKYEHYSRLKKILEGYTFSRTRHNRYHESEADSLAVVLLRNCKIPFNAEVFLRLDSSDMEYLRPLKKPLQEYFNELGLPFDPSWTQTHSKGLSSRNYNFDKSEGIADSLKTHPDCKERYEKTKGWNTAGPVTQLPPGLVEKVHKMIIWNTFDNSNLTACLYRIFQQKDRGGTDDGWYDFMEYNIFSGLAYSDNQLGRFNAIQVTPKEYISRSYYELQTLLQQMPRESLDQACKNLGDHPFWQKMPADARMMKGLFLVLMDRDGSLKTREEAARSFAKANSTSMYCEFADHFYNK